MNNKVDAPLFLIYELEPLSLSSCLTVPSLLFREPVIHRTSTRGSIHKCYSMIALQLPFPAPIIWYSEYQVALSKFLQSELNHVTSPLLLFQGWSVDVSSHSKILLTAVQSSPLGLSKGTYCTSRLHQVVIIGSFQLLPLQSCDVCLQCCSH